VQKHQTSLRGLSPVGINWQDFFISPLPE